MKASIIRFSIFILLLLSLNSNANHFPVKSGEGDHFAIHLNKSFYVTGETMWYTLYVPNALQGTNFSIEVQLVGKGGLIKDGYFLKSEGKNQIEGYYKIPFDWNTGIYDLVFSGVEDETKNRIRLAQLSLPIYNDLKKISTDVKLESPQNSNVNQIAGVAGAIDIQLDKKSYSQGEQVNATVYVKGANGKPLKSNISISVVDQKLGGDQILGRSSVKTFANQQVPTLKLSNDLYAFGQLTKEDDLPLNASIVGAFSPLENKVHYLKTNIDGKYNLKLPDFHGEKPLQILLYKSLEKFKVKEEKKISTYQGTPSEEVVYTDEIIEYIQQSRLRKKVYQFYGGVENDLKSTPVTVERSKLKPGLTYKMEEYETFDNVGEFFIEVITPLKFKVNKDNTFSGAIVNPRQYTSSTKTLDGDPLYIIDGKVTKDADFVGKINLTDIEEVKIYYNPNKLNEHYRAIAVGGVAEFTTKVDDFHIPQEEEEDIFIVKGIQPEGVFEMEEKKSNAPMFKPQVYWSPGLETNNKGAAKVSFTQSDDVSTFVIKVVAQAGNGEIIYGEQTYEVNRKSN